MVPTLQRAALGNAMEIPAIQTTSEDFSYYANEVPGLFVFLGATPPGQILPPRQSITTLLSSSTKRL